MDPNIQSKFDSIWGTKTPAQGMPTQTRADEIRALAKQNAPAEEPIKENTFAPLASMAGKSLGLGYAQKLGEEGQQRQTDLTMKVIQRMKDPKITPEQKQKEIKMLQDIDPDIVNNVPELKDMLNKNFKQIAGAALQTGLNVGTAMTAVPGLIKGGLGLGAKALGREIIPSVRGALGESILAEGSKLVGNAVPQAIRTAAGIGENATGIIGRGLQYAKTGLMGGAGYGGASNLGAGMQQNQGVGELAKTTLEGIGKGGVLGAGIGFATGAISGGLAQKATNKGIPSEKKALDAGTPKINELTKKEKQYLLDQGRITGSSKTKSAQVMLAPEEEAFIKKNADLLQGKPIENYTNISNRIMETDAGVGDYLKSSNISYDSEQLRKTLTDKLKDVQDVMIPEARLNKLKTQLVNKIVDNVPKEITQGAVGGGDNMVNNLWQARKEFDRFAEKELKAFSGAPALKKELARTIRTGAQDFIKELIPDGVYKGAMEDMTGLIKLNDTVGARALKEMGKTGIQNWLKNNPVSAKAWKLGKGIVGVGELGGLLHLLGL